MNPGRSPLFTATAAALALLCALQMLALGLAPATWQPVAIRVSLEPGESAVLGGASLGAPRAADAQLRVLRDAAGNWRLSAMPGASPVTLFHGERATLTASTVLAAGTRFAIGGSHFDVAAAGPDEVVLATAGVRWHYNGAVLYRAGEVLPPCPGAAWPARLVALLNRAAPAPLRVDRPLELGGNLYCGNRLGIAYAGPGSASVRRDGDRFVLAAAAREAAPAMLGAAGMEEPLAQQETALAGVTAMATGRTRFALSVQPGHLLLVPSGQVSLYPDASAQLPAGVQWSWQRRTLWQLPGGTAWALPFLLLSLAAAAAAFAFQRGSWPFGPGVQASHRAAAAAALLVMTGGATALAMQKAGTPPGAGISMLLGWAALWCWLLLPVRLSLAAAAGALLLGTGLLAQLELGLGAPDSSWLRYFQKTAALTAIGLGAGALVVLRRLAAATVPAQVRVEWSLALLAVSAIAALAIQVLFGDETGVFDLQPVEFAKLALVALSAHCLAIGMGRHGAAAHTAPGAHWLRIVAPVLVFAALLGVALVQVDDYSPLILLMTWAAAMAFAYAIATGRRAAALGLACAGVALAAAIGHARTLPAGEAWSFYGDRFLVWLDPLSHPHTGQQLLRGAEAIARGAWFGADSLFGVASLGQGAGDALRIPAVQDDFAPSFFVYRHGLAGALVLWLLQSAFLAGLVATAWRSLVASRASRGFRRAWQYRFRCFALCGGAAFVLGHLALSWGTNLAIVPVMGQPMSFLSAGGSHLLFFICPLLVVAVSSSQPFEEIEPCPSMSSTKSLAT